MTVSTIVYTHTDEAPALASASLLPIIRAFSQPAGIAIETADISLSGRILAAFSADLTPEQRQVDALAQLGEKVKQVDANIIKLPNISASMPQLHSAISELQQQGYALPDYPENPQTDAERAIRARYDAVKGSAVNPVLREGNSDRRAPKAVKNFAKKYPHSMGAWEQTSTTHVSTMQADDFAHNEKSITTDAPTTVRFVHIGVDGKEQELRAPLALQAGEIFDATVLRKRALLAFLETAIEEAKAQDVLFSLHMKATMMKVSDPIIFGHAVRAFFKPVFDKHADVLAQVGANPNNGWGDVLSSLDKLDAPTRLAVEQSIAETLDSRPSLAMVDSDKGITNLHVPSDVIIDASMPAMLRSSGKMWNKNGELQDTKAVIPDSSYAGIYQAVIEDCRAHGAFDPRVMGTVANVGLMAQKAEEYGSHDKTFEITAAGRVEIIDESGKTLIAHEVEAGDIWRACQTKDAAIKDWVNLAVKRAKLSATPAIFWLDANRAHDAQLIKKVETYLAQQELDGVEIEIYAPEQACRQTLARLRQGKDTISVTGNVLRDYLTDLFPILELGTSAKMLSIVPLINGGGLFETGAGGSAPKHVQQLLAENHLRWDSLGEFLALAVSFEHLAQTTNNIKAQVLADTLDRATETLLLEGKSPARKAGQDDNRSSHYWLARYWAKALSEQNQDAQLQAVFSPVAAALAEHEAQILQELREKVGQAVDIGGYYAPDAEKVALVMRPSATFNGIIASIAA